MVLETLVSDYYLLFFLMIYHLTIFELKIMIKIGWGVAACFYRKVVDKHGEIPATCSSLRSARPTWQIVRWSFLILSGDEKI